jgi:hypothetical protein
VDLPGAWLKNHVAPFRQIRVPARFNLLVAIVAALLAAAALKHVLERIRRPALRTTVLLGIFVLAFIDLANVPFPVALIPPPPAAYEWLRRHDPAAAILEIPQYDSSGSYLYPICAYWQSTHRGRTNAGYCGQANVRYDNLISRSTPFLAKWMERPDYLASGDREKLHTLAAPVEIVKHVGFLDYAWLFTTVHRFDYIMVHQWRDRHYHLPAQVRLKEGLRESRVFEDSQTVVFAQALLRRPERPTVMLTSGWRPTWEGRPCRVAERIARLAVYNPDGDSVLSLVLEAKAFRRARTVRLMAGDRALAACRIDPDRFHQVRSAPFHLPAGLQEIRLESDGEGAPRTRKEAAWETDRAPYSFRTTALSLTSSPPSHVELAASSTR